MVTLGSRLVEPCGVGCHIAKTVTKVFSITIIISFYSQRHPYHLMLQWVQIIMNVWFSFMAFLLFVSGFEEECRL